MFGRRLMLKSFKWLIVSGLLAYIYYPTALWMVDRWMARDSYFAHGFLIPLISAYWIFRKRKELCKWAVPGEGWGLLIVLAGALVQVMSSIFRIYFVSAISFVLILFGLVWFLFGRKVLKATWFPIAFLFLMIPLPLLMISEITLKMKFFVSEVATYLLNFTGFHTVRQGSYIYTPHSAVLVGDPCSGLRSFLAFLCLGLVFAYGSRMAFWKRLLLVAAGLPLAVLSNVLRVFSLSFLSEVYGMGVVTKQVHDASGFIVFILAFVCFIILRKYLEESGAAHE